MKREPEQLAGQVFDLLVIGGGVYGAWTAYDAVLRGLKVAIVERGDWAGATSSASSKLIHGGLRYLETFDFRLVRKALHERKRLLNTAPHRVWSLRFGVPVYDHSRIGRVKLRAGLMFYDLLAGWPMATLRHRAFKASGFAEHFHFIAQQGLLGGYTYSDAQTDDARLVLELIFGAQQAGAICVNYCNAVLRHNQLGKAEGVQIEDVVSGARFDIQAQQIVYAGGQGIAECHPDWCRLSKGVHLVLPALPGNEALLLTAPQDGRVFFLIPWYGRTLLGTTDTDYSRNEGQVRVERQDIEYLLNAANHYLSSPWKPEDIIASFAGLRVMRQSTDHSPSTVSRDWELKDGEEGVLYSVGGKLTSAREDAARVVDAVCSRLGYQRPCVTRDLPFPWTPKESYMTWFSRITEHALSLGVDQESAIWLLRRHGQQAELLLQTVAHDTSLAQRIVPDVPLILADLTWCSEHEMVVNPDDLLRRRLPLSILSGMKPDQLAQRISHLHVL